MKYPSTAVQLLHKRSSAKLMLVHVHTDSMSVKQASHDIYTLISASAAVYTACEPFSCAQPQQLSTGLREFVGDLYFVLCKHHLCRHTDSTKAAAFCAGRLQLQVMNDNIQHLDVVRSHRTCSHSADAAKQVSTQSSCTINN